MAEVIIEDVGPCKKHLKITVPQAEVQDKLAERYKRLRSTAVVAGFRKGHVPQKLLERRFGEEVLEEVKQTILSDTAEKAVKDNGLKTLGKPSFDNVDFAADKDFVFEVTLEIEPDFELVEYKGLKLVRKAVTVSDEEVDGGLNNVRLQHASAELMGEDAAVEPDDRIVCDWELTSEEETVAGEKNDSLVIRGTRFGEVDLEKDISEVFHGAKFGETRSVNVKFLDAYPIEKWRGKEGVLKITTKEIRRPVLPELNDEFAKQLDFESLDKLRDFVRQQIRRNKKRDVSMDLEQQLFDQLLQRMPFDVPEGVLKAQARNIMVRQQFRLLERGVPQEEIDKHLEELRGASEEAADRNLKIYFILDRIGEKEKIFATESEVENRIAMLANVYRTSAQRLRQQLQQEGSLAQLREGMREDKVTKSVMECAEISDE